MKRYHITLGAQTTAGGVVVTASSKISVNGVRIAIEGDQVNCSACGTTGLIRCIGPRISERWNGKQVALENDLCTCQCTPSPRLLPNQSHKSQTVADTSTGWVAPANLAQGSHGASYDQRFLLRDSLTDVPLARQPFRLKHGETIAEGVTDDDGYTPPIHTGDSAAPVEWLILGEVVHG